MSAPAPRVVITGIGVVSPFGVGPRALLGPRAAAAAAARARSPSSTRPTFACRVAAPVTGVTIDDVPRARRRRHLGRRTTAPIRSAIRARRSSASSPRARRGPTPGCAIGEPNAGVVIGSGGGGIDVGERQYHDFFVERGQQGHAVRDSGVDRRHGVERDLDLAAAARHQPRAVVRLHELDRRDRLRGGADPRRARPT